MKVSLRRSERAFMALGVCVVLSCLLAGAAAVGAQGTPSLPAKRVQIDVLAEKTIVAPGEEIWIALREKIAPGWHTYWVNPGDSGEPTTVTWQLPAGLEAGPLQFPVPHAIPVGPLVNYGYSDEAVLLARLKIPPLAKDGRFEITAKAEWLVCKDICIPESGEAKLTLAVAPKTAGVPAVPDHAKTIAAAVAALPKPGVWPVRLGTTADTIDLTFAGLAKGAARPGTVTFFPTTWGHVDHAAPQAVSWAGDDATVRLQRGDLKKAALDGLGGLLVLETGSGPSALRQAYAIQAGTVPPAAAAGGAPGGATAPTAIATPGAVQKAPIATPSLPLPQTGLLKALLFALLGGAILNLMPCVFPVLSLKAVALARQDRPLAERRADGLAYLAGVMASFGVLAVLLLGLRQAGLGTGWGFQFQSPVFVLAMAGLFFVLGLMLSGIVTFGGSLAGAGETLAQRSGTTGTFFTGALATIAATPCTAPFMGAAVGYALTASAFAGFLVLMAMGLGFAAPVVALSAAPGLQRLLPKPGRWMDTFKQVMAFPLYASAGWMVWVLSVQAGSEGVLAAMVLLVGLGFVVWLWTWAQPEGRPLPMAALGLAALAVVGIAAAQIPPQVPAANTLSGSAATPAAVQTDLTGLPIIPFSQARIAALQAEGRPVFVNVTAAWCITCKVNEKVALSSRTLHAAFGAAKVAYVKGDWTRQDPEISAFLQAFGRAGVPLYLFYPPRAGAAPRVLDQVLTEGSVLADLAAVRAGP